MMPSWCRQVNWGNCGIPWVNCAILCMKDDWKGQSRVLRYCQSKLRNLLSFFSWGMTSHCTIAPFNWVCIAPLRWLLLIDIFAQRPRYNEENVPRYPLRRLAEPHTPIWKWQKENSLPLQERKGLVQCAASLQRLRERETERDRERETETESLNIWSVDQHRFG